MSDFAILFEQAIRDARDELARLKELEKKRKLRESDYRTFDQMRGRLVNLSTELINAKDDAEMAEIARKALVKPPRKEETPLQKAIDNFRSRHPRYKDVACYNIAEEIWLLTYDDEGNRAIETRAGDTEAEAIEYLNSI